MQKAQWCAHVELGDVQAHDSGDVQGYSLQLQKEKLLPNQSPLKFWPELPMPGQFLPSKLVRITQLS